VESGLRDRPPLATASDSEWIFGDSRARAISVSVTRPRLRIENAIIRFQAALTRLGFARITITYCQDAVREGKLLQILPDVTCAPLRIYALMVRRPFRSAWRRPVTSGTP